MVATMFLALAILTEVAGTVALKFTDGFTRLVPAAVVLIGYSLSFYFMSLALKGYGIGALYAIWSGVGTTLIFFIGVWFMKEPFQLIQLLWVGLIIAGVVGLQMSAKGA